MAFKLADRVRETAVTTGTGGITLAGSLPTFRAFSTKYADGDTGYWLIVNRDVANEWEIVFGTYSSGPNSISRDSVVQSTNANALVNFSAGTKDITIAYPADKAVVHDANGDVAIIRDAQIGRNAAIAGHATYSGSSASPGASVRYTGPSGSTTNITRNVATGGKHTFAVNDVGIAYFDVNGLMATTDATPDFGASAAHRFRDFYFSRNGLIGGTLGVTGAVTGASFSGDGSALTALNATNLSSGTIASARVVGIYGNVTGLGTQAQNLIATDATYDLGASAATRFRDFFLSRNATIGGTLTLSGALTGATATFSGAIVVGTDAGGSELLRANGIRWGTNANFRQGGLVDNGTSARINIKGVGDVIIFNTASQIVLNTDTTTANTLLAGTDATYDLGAFGATRFRDFFLSRNATLGGTLTIGGAFTGATTGVFQSGDSIGTGALTLGADKDATSLTNATRKVGISSVPHYTNAEEKTLLISGDNDSATNKIYIGGAWNTHNAATSVVIYSAANNTTVTGSAIVTVTIAGLLASADATYDLGASGATRFRDLFLSRNATIGGTLGVSGLTTHTVGNTLPGVTITTGDLTDGHTTGLRIAGTATSGSGIIGRIEFYNSVSGESDTAMGNIKFIRDGANNSSAFVVRLVAAGVALDPAFKVDSAGAATTGTINGQTISSAASLTGSLTVATTFSAASGNFSVGASGSTFYNFINPGNDGAYNLGDTTHRISDVYAVQMHTKGDGSNAQLVMIDTDASVSTDTMVQFVRNGSNCGSITTTLALVTAYNTTSDTRLKRDLGNLPDLILGQLRIRYYERSLDGSREVGIFAQEVYPIVKDRLPYFITPGTDELDDNTGLPIHPWQVDWSKMVPELVLGWQNHEARIAALEKAA